MSTDVLKHSRRQPLAAGLAVILMLSAPLAEAATTWTVNTCDETNAGTGTTGTLRYAAANAVSGDTIDMTALTCSTITLSSGAIGFAQADITLKGPGKSALTVDGGLQDRVFRHTGNGTLAVNDLTVANGYHHPGYGSLAYGGCISSSGNVSLSRAAVRSCKAIGRTRDGHGGGIYAANGVIAKYSDITGNAANSRDPLAHDGGGGIFSPVSVVLASSTVSGNSASTGMGGGVSSPGNVLIIASTISDNTAGLVGGGICNHNPFSQSSGNTFGLINSTVSGNDSALVGGAWTNAGTIQVYNSTVAFNTALNATTGSTTHYSPGFTISDIGADPNNSVFKHVTLQSSVFSNNTYDTPVPTADDIGVARQFTLADAAPTSGENNLAFATTMTGLQGTLTTGACPRLGPLRDNGGPTRTHALMSGSHAIDAGNTLGTGISSFDQRGSPFARVSGALADMGAYEVQQADIIFNSGFDGCP